MALAAGVMGLSNRLLLLLLLLPTS